MDTPSWEQYVLDQANHRDMHAYDRAYLEIMGSMEGAMVISQLVYWSRSDTVRQRGGWVYKTQQDWDEYKITRRSLDTIRKKARELGIVEERRTGVPPLLYYRIIPEILGPLLSQTRLKLNDQSNLADRTNQFGGSAKSIRAIGQINLADQPEHSYLNSQILTAFKKEPPISPKGGVGDDKLKIDKSPKAKKPKTDDIPSGFGEFWQAYPRKEAKAPALRAWHKQKCEKIADTILEALKTHPALQREPQYIPLPATFLNQRRWEDEPARDPEADQATEKRQRSEIAYRRRMRMTAIDSLTWRLNKSPDEITEEEIADELERMKFHGVT